MTEAAEGTPKFDFITDSTFRSSLESDYRKLLRCIENGAWKAVHVLAGSVVEAILTDYLLGIGYEKKSGKKPLEMELGPIISACRSEKIITERTADLSSVVRSYRNLIHPGRVIRLNEKVDKKTASIAKALVDVVADEVAAAKEISYGFTAEQIANKIEKDTSAIPVLGHFLKDTNERERERLVAEVLPARLFLALELGDHNNCDDYERCHRQTFETLPDEAKSKVTKRFIKVLREDAGEYVLTYENAFFRAEDIKYLNPNDAALAKAHLLSRLNREQTVALLNVVEGLATYLDLNELPTVVNAFVRAKVYGKSQAIKDRASYLLFTLYFELEDDVEKKDYLNRRMDSWIELLGNKGLEEEKQGLEEIKSGWATEIPF